MDALATIREALKLASESKGRESRMVRIMGSQLSEACGMVANPDSIVASLLQGSSAVPEKRLQVMQADVQHLLSVIEAKS